MSTELFRALTAIGERLACLAVEDEQLRAHLRRLAQIVLEATETPRRDVSAAPAEAEPTAAAEVVSSHSATGNGKSAPAPLPQAESSASLPVILPELTLGRTPVPLEASAPSSLSRWTATTDADLPQIAARCRLKAEGARWAATRRRLLAEGAAYAAEIEPRDRDIIARAKALPDCFLWMCHSSGPSPSDLKRYDDLAGCFDALADCLAVLKQIVDAPDLYQSQFDHALDLLAEAQSALRVAVAAIDGPTDSDQVRVYTWLKSTAAENQMFIQRYMRVDDPADSTRWAELSSRIGAVDAAIQETGRRAKHRRKLLGKVRHKLSLIAGDPGGAEDHWLVVASVVDELVNDGLPPSNRELRDLLVPASDLYPELAGTPRGFQLVLREIDRFLATSPRPEPTSVTQPTSEVREVARLLEGRSMVLIGGERRPGSHQALKEAFGLRELIWLEAREHQSIDMFEPSVARPDVAVVLLAIRWSSHSFGEVRGFCERYGKPLVRLPGGYSPNQVAVQIMDQGSERLRQV